MAIIFFPCVSLICKLGNSNSSFNNLNYKAWQIRFCQKAPRLITAELKTNSVTYFTANSTNREYRQNHTTVPITFAMPLKNNQFYYRIQGIPKC